MWVNLFHQVGYVGEQGEVTCTFHGLSHTALELERSTGDATGQDFALLVKEFFEEFGILVINVLDTASFETAIFFSF